MYVIKTANGNIYPVEKCVYRIGAATGGGYKLTHLDLINVSSAPAPALQASLTAALHQSRICSFLSSVGSDCCQGTCAHALGRRIFGSSRSAVRR